MEVGDDFLRWYRSTPDAPLPFAQRAKGGVGEGCSMISAKDEKPPPNLTLSAARARGGAKTKREELLILLASRHLPTTHVHPAAAHPRAAPAP